MTYSIVIKNNSDKDYTNDLNVVENLSEYVEFKQQEVIYNTNDDNNYALFENKTEEGKLEWNIGKLKSGDEVKVTYTVTVKENCDGNIIESTGMVENISSGIIRNEIGNFLTQEQTEKIKEEYEELRSSNNGKNLINEIYKQALGIDLKFDEFEITNLITNTSSTCYSYDTVYLNKDNVFYNCVLNKYWSALNIKPFTYEEKDDVFEFHLKTWRPYKDTNRRADTIYNENFKTGDILIYKNYNDVIYSYTNNELVKTPVTYENGEYVYIYIEGKGFVGVNFGQDGIEGTRDDRNEFNAQYYGDNGLYVYSRENETNEAILEYANYQTLFGKDYYVILRPALQMENNTKNVITPNIMVKDKIYDGMVEIDPSNISISNLNSSDYTITWAVSHSVNVGDRVAVIKIKLTDDAFEQFSFDNGKQEKVFYVEFKILPLKIVKPIQPNYGYTYTGEEITFEFQEYDENSMILSGNKEINSGVYDVEVTLANENYIWEDGTTSSVILKFEIFKANLGVKDNCSNVTVKYDGEPHTINFGIEYDGRASLKFLDKNNKYTLDKLPKYTDIGTYIIKYKVYMDENYTEYFGERTLTITANTVTNNSMDYEGIYDGNEHSINLDIKPTNYSIKYSINNTNFDLTELSSFKEVGEYTVYYKITAEGYDDLIGSNKVKIYGLKEFENSIIIKDNKLIVEDNSLEAIKNKIKIYSTSNRYYHYNSNNEINTSDVLKTRDIIKINLNNLQDYEYHIVVLGDTNGDGKTNYLDYVKVYNHIQKVKHPVLDKKLLENEFLLAADMSKDNKISYLDYVKIYNKIKELKGGTN